jgi:hypothetical protein
MNDAVLNRIRGRRISGFSFVKYPYLGLDRVILHLESDLAFEFNFHRNAMWPMILIRR